MRVSSAGVVAVGVLAAMLCLCSSAPAAVIDLTKKQGTINGGRFIATNAMNFTQAHLRQIAHLQKQTPKTYLEGYNTSVLPMPFDMGGTSMQTRSVQVKNLTVIHEDGEDYYQFVWEHREPLTPNTKATITLDQLKIFTSSDPLVSTTDLSKVGKLWYDMNPAGSSTHNYVFDTSVRQSTPNKGKMFFLLPTSMVKASAEDYLYLYSRQGDTQPLEGMTADWFIISQSELPGPVVPEPASLGLLACGTLLALRRRRAA